MAAKPKKQMLPSVVTGLARDQGAPMVSLNAKKPKKISRARRQESWAHVCVGARALTRTSIGCLLRGAGHGFRIRTTAGT
jgi:hypothetical protein